MAGHIQPRRVVLATLCSGGTGGSTILLSQILEVQSITNLSRVMLATFLYSIAGVLFEKMNITKAASMVFFVPIPCQSF
jgi:hypothetical protein